MPILTKELDLTNSEKENILDFVRVYGKDHNRVQMRRELETLMHKVRRSTKYQILRNKQPII